MWRVQAFVSNPQTTRRTVSASKLSAISSRELRFHNGGPRVLPRTTTTETETKTTTDSSKHGKMNSSAFSSMIPDVLAASMSNYFFTQAMTAGAGRPQNDEQQQQQRYSYSSASSHFHATTLSSSSTTLVEVAPHPMLVPHPQQQQQQQQQRTYRASSSSRNRSGPLDDIVEDNDDQDEWSNGLYNRLNQHRANGNNNNMDAAHQQDDNTSPLRDDDDDGNSHHGHPIGTSAQYPPPRQGYGYSIQLTDEERALFHLLRQVHEETHLTSTLRVAGGWVRDKLLATPEFQIFHRYNYLGKRLTSKFKAPSHHHDSTTTTTTPPPPPSSRLRLQNLEQPSMGRQGTKVLKTQSQQSRSLLHYDFQGPVDIDIALDTMLGREFADHLNDYLQTQGEDTVSVGVVLKNPEKSKHLETATMKVGAFWIDFVNLRAEEYAEDSRIPDLMRIGTAKEDAFRRDLTINSLFFNINTGEVEDWTGRGFADLRKGVVATPLAPLTTLLDDPLRVLRSIRFAARLRFTMGDELVDAAKDDRVRMALAQKVSRERVGGEVDLMLRSPDPVGAMRLLINLKLVGTVFPVASCWPKCPSAPVGREALSPLFDRCLNLLSTTHEHLYDCKVTPPVWCQSKELLTTHNVDETILTHDEEARRLLWYAAFLKPVHDRAERMKQHMRDDRPTGKRAAGKKANRSIMSKLLVDELKRPGRDAENVEKIMKAADEITQLIQSGCDVSATLVLLSEVKVKDVNGKLVSTMRGRTIDAATEDDPVWDHAMEFRLLCSQVLRRVGGLWRAALMLSLSEQLAWLNEDELEYAIEGDVFDESKEERRQGIIEQYDGFAAALQQIGLIGSWGAKPLVDGQELKEKVLPYIPRGPAFRDVMDEQERWMTTHPGASKEPLMEHMTRVFPEFTKPPPAKKQKKKTTTETEEGDKV